MKFYVKILTLGLVVLANSQVTLGASQTLDQIQTTYTQLTQVFADKYPQVVAKILSQCNQLSSASCTHLQYIISKNTNEFKYDPSKSALTNSIDSYVAAQAQLSNLVGILEGAATQAASPNGPQDSFVLSSMLNNLTW